jgi:hypothetical protein
MSDRAASAQSDRRWVGPLEELAATEIMTKLAVQCRRRRFGRFM